MNNLLRALMHLHDAADEALRESHTAENFRDALVWIRDNARQVVDADIKRQLQEADQLDPQINRDRPPDPERVSIEHPPAITIHGGGHHTTGIRISGPAP